MVTRDDLPPLRRIAGADVSYDRGSPTLFAAAVVLDAQSLEVLEVRGARAPARFPYVPGFLSFREAPAVLRAFSRLRLRPDLLIADGHGLAHPRRFGLACHLGVLLNLPSFGCAKSRLIGEHLEPGPRRGAHRPLRHRGEKIGEALRTRSNTKPVFISIGHRISLHTARRLALAWSPRTRIPEPVRLAHQHVNRLRRAAC